MCVCVCVCVYKLVAKNIDLASSSSYFFFIIYIIICNYLGMEKFEKHADSPFN